MHKVTYLTTITEGESFKFNNHLINVWKESWYITDEKIEVTDPLYNQKHLFNIWTIKPNNKEVRFAIGEFSNLIYGIFLVEEET